MKKILILALCFVVAQVASAQQLMPRVAGFSMKKTAYITMKDGKKLEGRVRGAKFKKGVIKQLTLKLEDDTKMKIKATDIKDFKAPASGLGKFAAAMEATSDVRKMGQIDEAMRDYGWYEQATLPIKKKTVVLLQLVNPGFDSKIKVYDDPRAAETASASVGGVTVAGGLLKSYYVTKNGKTIRLKKGDYKKEFKNLFGDCPKLMKMLKEKDVKWKDFGEHVWIYDQECGG